MDRDKIDRINRDRLDGWRMKLTNDHATPMLLLGIKHDHRSGDVVVCVPEDAPPDIDLARLLRAVAARLEGGAAPGSPG